MNITFDFHDVFLSIEQEINNIPKAVKTEVKPMIQKASKIIKKNIESELSKLPVSEAVTNYDGSMPYVHMKDDVKSSVKDDQQGFISANIRGGKFTAYKWHLVDNGTSRSRARHFIDKAMQQSETDINALVNEIITKAVK